MNVTTCNGKVDCPGSAIDERDCPNTHVCRGWFGEQVRNKHYLIKCTLL